MSRDVLDMIDHAVSEWGADAMRWSPEAPTAEEAALVAETTAAAFAQLSEALRPVWDELRRALEAVVAALGEAGLLDEGNVRQAPGGRGLAGDFVIVDELNTRDEQTRRQGHIQRRQLLHGRSRRW